MRPGLTRILPDHFADVGEMVFPIRAADQSNLQA